MHSEINQCRVCGNPNLIPILELGSQCLTGVFPSEKNQVISNGPLELVKCSAEKAESVCGLLQLKQSYDLDEMYGTNYGYRSGLNHSMVTHLEQKVLDLLKIITINERDIILDIGSNDGTFLNAFPNCGASLVGIDPTGKKFGEYYADHVELIPDFFSPDLFTREFGSRKAKLVTSIAMFYDLEAPLHFMQQIESILADDGIWHFEQSYMPTMLKQNAYDTVCHEHLEYYGLKQIKWMTEKAGFKIIEVGFNNINGGSFWITACKKNANYAQNQKLVESILKQESESGLDTPDPYFEFRKRVFDHRDQLVDLIHSLNSSDELILGYGASTKGNVILQFCGFSENDIPAIAEVNRDKFGCYTPGTLIPIIPEGEAKAMAPDHFLVLPWHFRDNFLKQEADFLQSGGKLLFPLPKIESIGANG